MVHRNPAQTKVTAFNNVHGMCMSFEAHLRLPRFMLKDKVHIYYISCS